ncbi:ATP-binding protein [Yinghuangia aomiensis]
MAVGRDDVAGRLILLHGPPGTGKTTVLRSLAREWRDWCRVDCVLDPEALFGDTGYLMDVAIGRTGEEDDAEQNKWRLLVLEDCDELIRGEAKRSTGQALSRLLNLTDGLLGQGRNVLVAITTNESLGALHPAVVRPGRCLAQIEVGPLDYSEASAWLGTSQGVGGSATLAELYALKNGGSPVEAHRPPIGDGMYL